MHEIQKIAQQKHNDEKSSINNNVTKTDFNSYEEKQDKQVTLVISKDGTVNINGTNLKESDTTVIEELKLRIKKDCAIQYAQSFLLSFILFALRLIPAPFQKSLSDAVQNHGGFFAPYSKASVPQKTIGWPPKLRSRIQSA